jgi:trichothecene 3-O-acetyltransferase
MVGKDRNFGVRSKNASARVFKLSIIDQYVPKQWITRAFFFPAEDHEQVYGHLREGLSRTLTRLPILAGRVRREYGQYASIEVEEDSEVYFGVQDSELPSYARLREEDFPMRQLAELAAPAVLTLPVTEGSGVFAAQLSFVEGGIVLVFGIAHLVGDATAWATITRLWAQYTVESFRGEESILAEIHTDRSQLSQGTVERQQDSRLWAVCEVEKSPMNLPKPIAPRKLEKKAPLSSWRIWYLSEEKLRQLKQDSSPSTGWISTNDALFALFWHRSTIYRKLGRFETSSCRIPIDVRSRMQPPIVEFVGNAVSMFAAEASIAELERDDGLASVSALAQKIRQTILSWEVSSFTSWIAKANDLPVDKALHHPSGSVVDPNILLNDHSKLDTCKLEWGFGRVECIRGIDQDYPFPGLALIILFPVLVDGGIEVATVFDNHVNEGLEGDELFMRYAELRLS